MDGRQFYRNSFFLMGQHDESLLTLVEQNNFSSHSSYEKCYPQSNLQNLSKSTKPLRTFEKALFSDKKSTNQLKNKFELLETQKYQRQRRYLSTIDKRNFDLSFQDVSPWNASYTPRQKPNIKNNFLKQRQKIKQMIYEYRLNKTIDLSTKEHANFIKSSKSKKKKVNLVLLQYQKIFNPTQRPLSLIKSVDVNKSYENYLNNGLQIDKNFFKIPIKIKNQKKKQISSCRMYTKESQKDKDKTIKQELTEMIKDDLIYSNHLDDLQVNLSRKNLSKKNQSQKAPHKKKVLEKVLMLRNQRNKKGLRNQITKKFGQESHSKQKIIIKEEKLQFSVSGNKTHKLQYQSRQSHFC